MEKQREIKVYDNDNVYRDSFFVTSDESLKDMLKFGMVDSYKFNFDVGHLEEVNYLEQLKNNEVLKEILKDSFGGVMYNMKNINKYDTVELLKIWDNLDNVEKENIGGIIEGAIQFIKNE